MVTICVCVPWLARKLFNKERLKAFRLSLHTREEWVGLEMQRVLPFHDGDGLGRKREREEIEIYNVLGGLFFGWKNNNQMLFLLTWYLD